MILCSCHCVINSKTMDAWSNGFLLDVSSAFQCRSLAFKRSKGIPWGSVCKALSEFCKLNTWTLSSSIVGMTDRGDQFMSAELWPEGCNILSMTNTADGHWRILLSRKVAWSTGPKTSSAVPRSRTCWECLLSENNWSQLLLKIRRQGNVLKSHEEVSPIYNVFHQNIDADNGRARATPLNQLVMLCFCTK